MLESWQDWDILGQGRVYGSTAGARALFLIKIERRGCMGAAGRAVNFFFAAKVTCGYDVNGVNVASIWRQADADYQASLSEHE